MRKIGVLLAFVFMAIVLVACGSKPAITDLYVSFNRVEFDYIEQSNIVDIKKDDIEVYTIKSDGTVTKVERLISVLGREANGTTNLKISVDDTTITKEVTVFSKKSGETLVPNKLIYGFNLTTGLTADADKANAVKRAMAPLITNQPDTEKITVLVAGSQAPITGDALTYNYDDFDQFLKKAKGGKIVENGSYSVAFDYQGTEITHTFENVFTFKKGSINPIHPKTASWHWDWVLVIPIATILQFFSFGNSFAWGILFATIIVRTLAWPIYAKSNALSMKMALAQPELQRLNEKYATRKDPASMQKKQMEMMKINKKYGVNYLGCLMPLLQTPIFIAMYQVVSRITVEGGMYADKVSHKTMLWGLIDLTSGSDIASYFLAAIVGITMYLLNRISSKRPGYAKQTGTQNKSPEALQQEKTMKMVNYVMIFAMVMGAFANNALAFYWIVGNIFSIGQTLITRKLAEIKYNKEKNKVSI